MTFIQAPHPTPGLSFLIHERRPVDRVSCSSQTLGGSEQTPCDSEAHPHLRTPAGKQPLRTPDSITAWTLPTQQPELETWPLFHGKQQVLGRTQGPWPGLGWEQMDAMIPGQRSDRLTLFPSIAVPFPISLKACWAAVPRIL